MYKLRLVGQNIYFCVVFFLAIKWVQNGFKKGYIEMRVYFYIEMILKCARMVTFILLEPSSQDDGVGQLYQALGGLTFSPIHEGAYPNGGFKIF